MRSRLANFKVHWDMWFTGADFAGSALQQLAGAIRRRQLSYSECFFDFFLGCITTNNNKYILHISYMYE